MVEEEVIEIVKRGPKLKYKNGYKEHYKDINYNLSYYHSHKTKINCDCCGKEVNKAKIREHQKSKKCLKYKTTIVG
jgi:hypothetical protein